MDRKKSILLLGSCGYAGSALYDYLKSSGYYDVAGVDLQWFGNRTGGYHLLWDYSTLPSHFYAHYDVVILLAGLSSVGMCVNEGQEKTFNHNVVKFQQLLERLDKQKLIYMSSASVYGDTHGWAANENYDLGLAQNHYDASKQMIDILASTSNVEYYGLRCGTINGYSYNLRAI